MSKRGYLLPNVLTGHPIKRVCFDIPDVEEYRQAFWGQVWELGKAYKWVQDVSDIDDPEPEIAAQYWRNVLWETYQRYLHEDDCGIPEPNTCQTYPPTAAFIQYFPNDPVYTPDFVGDGYNNPAWYFATLPSNIAYGSQYGDVITSLDRFPPGSLPDVIPASGLPRFRINVNGIGTVKAKLVNMFGGSIIQTTVDDNIATLNFIDVSKDTVSAPPETNGELIVQFDLTTPGAHHIDFIVISWLTTSVPFLHHGGGLRSVELCGFDEMPVYSPPFRFTEDCLLQFYDGENWQDVTGWGEFAPDCFRGADGADGATLFIRDTGNGQLQTSPDSATWADVTNAKYVHLNGDIPMTGGLEIEGTTDEIKLTVKSSGSPFQTAKLVSFRDASNNEMAWVNPRGDAVFSGDASGLRALNLLGGGIGIDHNKYMYWKDSGGTVRIAFGVGSNTMFFRSFPSGLRVDDSGGNAQMEMTSANLWRFYNSVPTTGVTQFRVKSGAAQGSSALITLEQNNGNSTLTVGDTGNIIARRRDQATNAPADVLQLDNRATVPGGAGLGVNLRMSASSSTQSAREQAILRTAWEDATDATRKATVSLIAFDTAEREIIKGRADGTLPEIGFLGKTPQPRITITGDIAGNEALQNIITIIEGFGLVVDSTVDTGLPTPEMLPQFTRCQIASRAGRWMLDWYEYNISSFLYLTPLFGGAESYIETVTSPYMYDQVLMVDYLDLVAGIFSPSTETEFTAHMETVRANLLLLQSAIYCALDENGCIETSFADVFKALYISSDPDVTQAAGFFATFGNPGFAKMLTNSLLYGCADDISCAGIECDLWDVLFTNTSPDLNVTNGSASGSGWSACDGEQIRIELAGFNAYRVSFTTSTNVGDPISLPPDQIRAYEYGTTDYHYATPHTGANDVSFTFSAPAGLVVEVSYAGTSGDCIELHALRVQGIGTSPTA